MYTEQWIREKAGSAVYNQGRQLYLNKRVQDLALEDIFGDLFVHATLMGDIYASFYETYFIYSYVEGSVMEYSCTCEDFTKSKGPCKHCVALLLEYLDYTRSNNGLITENADLSVAESTFLKNIFEELLGDSPDIIESPGFPARDRAARPEAIPQKRHTTHSLHELMVKNSRKKLLPMMEKEQFGKIKLVPFIFSDTDGYLYVEFRIGTTTVYVLKDIVSFMHSIQKGESVKYGKKLEFVHSPNMFAKEYQPLLHFIMNWYRNNEDSFFSYDYYGYSYDYSYRKVRHITLYNEYIDNFFDAIEEIGYQVKGGKEVYFPIKNKPDTSLYLDGKEYGLSIRWNWPHRIMGERYCNFIQLPQIYRVPIEEYRAAEEFMDCLEREGPQLYVAEEEVPVFCRELLPTLKKCFTITSKDFDEKKYLIGDVSFEIYLDMPQKDWVSCEVLAVYGEEKYSVYEQEKQPERRDIVQEMELGQRVAEYFTAYDNTEKKMMLTDEEDKLFELLTEGISWMQSVAEVFISDKIKKLQIERPPRVNVGVSVNDNGMELTLLSEDMSMAQLLEILSQYTPKRKYYRLKNGNFISAEGSSIHQLAELREGLNLTDRQLRQGTMTLPKYRALYMDGQFKNAEEISLKRDSTFRHLIRNMKSVEDNDYEVPASLQNILRDYQKQGFGWLKTLHDNGFGGILADDMGLGKTLQVIAFLLSETEAGAAKNSMDRQNSQDTAPKKHCFALVVTPASLVYNWESEFLQFAPTLPVKPIVGTQAQRESLLSEAEEKDILVTSYDLLKRDIALYEHITFTHQIIDEAQYIKNPNTQAAQAAKEIHAGFHLALTGTPIENRLSELWSIFDYLMPGFLYSYKHFKDHLEMPIVQNNDENTMHRLQVMVRPFILRRLKKDVLRDLPDKLEKNMVARLEGEQLKLYDAHVKRLKLLLEDETEEEFRKSKIQILSELTKLRQICCDPALIFEDYKASAAKLDMCMELIENAVSSGHKILLFSQFTSMLARIEKALAKHKISYYTLTGSTSKTERRRLVTEFNQDNTSVFCISLKAGGTGLNLTAADIVIHFDPWWNEAVQNQATDRAHRIGQKNVVTVYRLLTKGTIEERIVEMQATKKALSDQILGSEEMSQTSFSKEELLELLS